MKIILVLIAVATLSSCSMAPFTSPKSASSLGKGKWEVTAGFSPSMNISVARGFSDRFDAGFLLEEQFFLEAAVWGRFSLIDNKDDGGSVAIYGGAFQALDASSTNGFFVGPILSYKKNWFETYLLARYNSVSWDSADITLEDQNDSSIITLDWGKGSTQYLQYVFGLNFWFTQKFALNISAQYWDFLGSDAELENVVPGVELIWHF